MILPLGDAPNPRGVPIVTYGLIAVNVMLYLLITVPLSVTAADVHDPALLEYLRMLALTHGRPIHAELVVPELSAYDLFTFRYGFRPADPQVVPLAISLFLHAGFLHLFGNMLFLWIYGNNVEHRLGGGRYLLAYIGGGAAATLFHALVNRDSPAPLIGASGAISAVLGLYYVWFPRNEVRLLVLLFPFLMNVVTVPARFLLGFYVIVDNLLPFLLADSHGGGIAYGAHIGGFVAGLVAARLIDRRALRAERTVVEPTVEPPRAAVRAALDAGRFADATRLYLTLAPELSRGVLAPDESLALGDWLQRASDPRAALIVYRRHLRDYPHHATAAAAHLGAGLLQLEHFGQTTAAYQHFLDALDLDPPPAIVARVRAALDTIAAGQRYPLGLPTRRRQ